MATVLDIRIMFNFTRGSETYDVSEEFNCVGFSLQSEVDDRAAELLEDLNNGLDDGEDEWEFDGYDIVDFDSDWMDPDNFSDLDEYSDYAEKVEEHGYAYHARYEDLGGDFDFDDSYNGEWGTTEEFVENLIENCYGLELPSFVHVDWERTARDVMMDYSEYREGGSVHIFRD